MEHRQQHRVVLIGHGQIAKSQHVPVMQSRGSLYKLCGIIDPHIDRANQNSVSIEPSDHDLHHSTSSSLVVPVYKTIADAIASTNVQIAVIACPPQFAQDYADQALQSGLDVLMEKPPGFRSKRLENLQDFATKSDLTLFTAFHSTFGPEIAKARNWIQSIRDNRSMIERVTIEWKESAVKWHPGQTWISQNEFAVLDILINPISILGEILGFTLLEKAVVERSKLWRPKNWKGPIAGSTTLVVSADSNSRSCGDMTIQADYAWNYEGEDIWRIEFLATDDSTMELYDGGAQLTINGKRVTEAITHDNILRPEYEAIYDRFEELLRTKDSQIHVAPLRIMEDILERSTRKEIKNYYLCK